MTDFTIDLKGNNNKTSIYSQALETDFTIDLKGNNNQDNRETRLAVLILLLI